jgi:CHAT domain-containing protein
VPKAFWEVLAQVIAAVAPQVPAIQILSAEAHVPWELAVMPATVPLADPQAPRYLGAQADVGRWVLGDPPPRVPPPGSVRVSTIAAISGVYPGVANLEEAEAEAEALETTYHAVPVDAQVGPVVECLSRDPSYDVVHFSVHADYGGTAEGAGAVAANPRVLLADGTELDEATVRGFEPFAGSPFVFLNACQVGSGNELLGDYAGLAQSFLYAGAAGVVAPLWSVSDTVARELALDFYERAFVPGATAAGVLRGARARYADSGGDATWLAYQFFGHPAMALRR